MSLGISFFAFYFYNIGTGRVLRGKKGIFEPNSKKNPSHISISRAYKFTIHLYSNTFFKTTQNLYWGTRNAANFMVLSLEYLLNR